MKSVIHKSLFLLFCVILHSSASSAQPVIDSDDLIVLGRTGTDIWLSAEISIPASAYVYGNPKGPGIGKPLTLEISDPSRIVRGKPFISIPQTYHPIEDDFVFIYRESFSLAFPVTVQKDESVLLLKISGLMCTDKSCMPFSLNKRFIVRSSPAENAALSGLPAGMIEFGTPPESIRSEKDRKNVKSSISPLPSFSPRFLSRKIESLFPAILFGLLAGLLLNIMPCVLPVLALKVAGVVKHAHDRKKTVEGGLLYASGIISFFLLITALVVFAGYRWGSFFQSSSFLIVVILVLSSFALSLLGVYTLQMPSFAAKAVSKEKSFLFDSFSKGFLAALLATPCSGPFLGSVLAWSLTRSGAEKSAVFLSIGLGLAFPYLLVTVFPSLVRFIPKPGKWTIVFEKIMGLLLILSAVYFTLILNRAYYLPVAGMVFIATLGLWQFGKFGSPVRSITARRISLLLLVLLSAAALSLPFSVKKTSSPHSAAPFTIESVRAVSSAGRISAVVFTADWCPNCKLVEKAVLESDRIEALVRKKNITLFYADITEKGTEGEELLTRLGGTAIPFLAVFPAEDKFTSPVCLRDIYTIADFEEAVRTAAE